MLSYHHSQPNIPTKRVFGVVRYADGIGKADGEADE